MTECTATSMCDALAERTDPHAAKGFRSYWTVNRESREQRFFGVAYATGRADRGLMLNVCPFCKGAPGHFERS